MDSWISVDPRTGEFAPAAVDLGTGRLPPSRGAVALAASALAACVAYVGLTLALDHLHGAVIMSPVFLGAFVGFSSLRRPMRNAACVLAVAFALWALALGGYALYLVPLLPLPFPGLLIGALCGNTLRRFARARRHRAFAS